VSLTLNIQELSSLVYCPPGNVCDADLIIGIGDWALDPGGWFVVYRSLAFGSDILLCLLQSVHQRCEQPPAPTPAPYGNPQLERFPAVVPTQDIRFQINGLDLTVIVNGLSRGPLPLEDNYLSFWIAYRFVSNGRISAFIRLPSQ
jgi:hypothetical protein